MEFTKRYIPLPKGGTLEVDMTQKFLDTVKTHFSFSSYEDITDDHIRMFIWGSFKNAIDKSTVGN